MNYDCTLAQRSRY